MHPWWYDVECLDGCSLLDFVYPQDAAVSKDTLRLLALELDKCVSWSEEEPAAVEPVTIRPVGEQNHDPAEEVRLENPLSVGIALAAAKQAMMACLVFPSAHRRGWYASIGDEAQQVYFFSGEGQLSDFWRRLFAAERIPEADFFTIAPYAFPSLAFHPELSFRKFDGQYRDLRDRVVRALGIINDHFSAALARHAGMTHRVNGELGSHGLEVTLESSSTRGSAQLMGHRMVSWDGHEFCCEWHAKLEPHRNRIHFSQPLPDGRILVGIFTSHLPTM